MAIVIDASVAVAWCFSYEEGNSSAEAVAMQIIRERGIAPTIFWYEVRNVLVGAERTGRISLEGTERFLLRLDQLQLHMDHEHDEPATLSLARRHRLSAYDAAYLETALRQGAKLATLDSALAAAASSEGVDNPARLS